MDDLLKELEGMNALAAARNDFAKSLALLRALKAGTVLLDQVTVTADGWQVAASAVQSVAPDGQSPALERLREAKATLAELEVRERTAAAE